MDILLSILAVAAAAYAVYWVVKRERVKSTTVDAALNKVEAKVEQAAAAAKVEIKETAAEVKAEVRKVVEKVEEKAKAATKGRKTKK